MESASAEAQPLGLCCAGGLTTSAVVNSTTMPHPPEPAMSRIERQQFRRICGKFASGITVVTVRDLVGLVVLCIYAAYTIKIYCANKEAADAAKSAAETAQKTL